MLLSIDQLREILGWFKEPGPKLEDYDKPLLYKVIGYAITMVFCLTVIAVDNVALGVTARIVFIVSFVHVIGFFILSQKRANENFKNRKALEQ